MPLLVVACGPSETRTNSRGVTAIDGGTQVSCTNPKDSDGDGISDAFEGANLTPPTDTDGDGTPDYLDADSDNDGIPDAIEGRTADLCSPPVDADNDGVPDFRDLDSDDPANGSIPDALEAGLDPTHPVDTNNDGRPDYMDADNDGDGIPDLVELTPIGQAVAAITLTAAPDTDGDGVPDFLDLDSDGDTIADKDETDIDTDGDGVPNYRDLDSDGDCIADALEAGDADLTTPPVDTNNNGIADFEDLDSDGDGLRDQLEDKNCNGVADACETSRILADTDMDGVSDLIETEDCQVKPVAQQAACSCDGDNASVSPLTLGDFVFTVPYMASPTPSIETLSLATNISQADVLFVIDTTGSMSSAISAIETGLSGIVTSVQSKVSNVAFGVSEFRDFDSDDPFVFKYDYRITSANTSMSPTIAGVKTALQLPVGDGGDSPEAGWEALYAIAGGATLKATSSIGGSYTSAISLGSISPLAAPAGEQQGTVGGAGFRAGSVPIVVTVSDAGWHDAAGQSSSQKDALGNPDTHAGFYDYGSVSGVPSREAAVAGLQGLGARVIGIAATNATSATGDSTTRMTDTANDTGAVVTPADFGSSRPSGCSASQCCTGVSGAGVAPDATGKCPLAFQYNDGNGAGISSAVSAGIIALANGAKFDIHVRAVDVDPNTVENFMLNLVPNVSGTGPAAMCVVVPLSSLEDNFTGPLATAGGDGTPDTFKQVGGGEKVCFDVIPKMNTTVQNAGAPQFYHAQLQVEAYTPSGGTITLGTPRDVFFLVPPSIVNGPT